MNQIGHLYFRASIIIDDISDYLFLGSDFEELFIENAKIHSTDLSFAELRAGIVRLTNLTWSWLKKDGGKSIAKRLAKHLKRHRSFEIYLKNCIIQRLFLFSFDNASIFSIQNSTIKHLYGSHFSNFGNLSPKRIDRIMMVGVQIDKW